ncbi:restriction endonuclease subunit S [Gluconobacter kondonii]|uniref:restriction endonuclease subunit S n=1 Tax=Gluconobacter kondonii TaxID=941463 RepID=UPI001B8CDB3E|nr:restriction endonuclease subunit S [Gluconobacter kondonii]MBS1078257.1 restriction endonuclease subunit S [Gluconobacter kondonii]
MSWPEVALGEVADVNWGDTSVTKKSYSDEGFTAFSATGPDGFLPYYDFDREGIVLSAIGARCGKTWFAQGKWSVIKNTIRFWSERDDLDNRFLYWLTANPDFWPKRGAAQPFITIGDARALKIPLPPLEEQKRIAGILDQAAELCRLRTQALDRLNTLGQAIFHEMFGDPATNPYGWNLTTLPELGTLDRGVSKHRPRNDPTLLGGDHPLIQTGDVSRALDYITEYASTYSDLGLSQSRKWASGTVCITIAANIADTAILDFDACFPDSVVGFDSGSPETNFFVHRWFSTVKRRLENIAPAVAQKNINLKILRELPVIKPPSQLIEEYYAKERQIRAKCVLVGRAAEESQTLFASLQHRAFRGEL